MNVDLLKRFIFTFFLIFLLKIMSLEDEDFKILKAKRIDKLKAKGYPNIDKILKYFLRFYN